MEIIAVILLLLLGLYQSKSDKNNNGSNRSNSESTSIPDFPVSTPNNKQHHPWTYEIDSEIDEKDEYWEKVREDILKRDNFRCAHCGFSKNLTVHHITPRSAGGSDDYENLITLCVQCHENKHGRKIFDSDGEFIKRSGFTPHKNKKAELINSAVYSGRSLSITYEDDKGNVTEREIKPKKVFEEHGLLYVRAYCKLRGEDRTFRISRITLT